MPVFCGYVGRLRAEDPMWRHWSVSDGLPETYSFRLSAAPDVERYYRDAPVLTIGGGTSQIQRQIIAKQTWSLMAIRIERADGAAIVTIADSESLNALADFHSLAAAWDELEAVDTVRVVVLTGEGDRAFCSGANLKEFIPLLTGELRAKHDPCKAFLEMDFVHRAFLKRRQLSKPLVAAVNGLCYAGGVELLQACDIRIAVETAEFSLQEQRWGLFPACGSTVRLPRQIPFAWAMEILLVGDRLNSRQALEAGLVNRMVARAELANVVRGVHHANRIERAARRPGHQAIRALVS
jgi:enoyl-CoA hydratase